MRYVMVRLASLMLAVLALARPAPATAGYGPAPIPPLPHGFMGMVARDPYYDFNTSPAFPNAPNQDFQDETGRRLADLGVEWVRIEYKMEPGDDPNVAAYDYFIRNVAPRHNLKILLVLGYDLNGRDPFSLEQGPATSDACYGGGVTPDMKQWLDNALRIAGHYQNQVHAYQTLNEQNRLPPVGAAIDADIYARLHTKFYRLLKIDGPWQTNPACTYVPDSRTWRDQVQIVTGGLHAYGTTEQGKPYQSDIGYVREMYRVFYRDFYTIYGRYPLDALAYHPYPEEIIGSNPLPAAEADLINERLNRVRQRLCSLSSDPKQEIRADDCGRPLWITEVGYNVGYFKVANLSDVTTRQATFMLQTYRTLARRGDVAVVFWFKYEDFPPAEQSCTSAGCQDPSKWGVVRIPFTADPTAPGGARYDPSGVPALIRPAYATYQVLSGVRALEVQALVPVVGR